MYFPLDNDTFVFVASLLALMICLARRVVWLTPWSVGVKRFMFGWAVYGSFMSAMWVSANLLPLTCGVQY